MWGWVGLHGRPWVRGYGPFIDEQTPSGDPQRATMKAHTTSTQPPSPLRNPRLGLRLLLIGVDETTVSVIHRPLLTSFSDALALRRWGYRWCRSR